MSVIIIPIGNLGHIPVAVICGDIHGNLEKTRAFLDYKPDDQHIALGDYLDSFYEPLSRQLMTLQTLLDSKTVLLWGNHDLHYLQTPPWYSMGFQWGHQEPMIDLIENNKRRFMAAYAVDGWLLTHAGLAYQVAESNNVVAIADKLNLEMSDYINSPIKFQLPDRMLPCPPMFQIGKGRGGNGVGGIFWFDFLRESGLVPVKQIFGHTETREGPVVKEDYIALDTTNNKSICWFYDTAINEIDKIQLPRRIALISELPEDEQEPFTAWLMGQTVPIIGGYYEGDYMRWKQIYG